MPISYTQFLEIYNQHATGHDIIYAGHCRLIEGKDGKVLPCIGNFISDNPDGLFPDYTLDLAIKAINESYQTSDCDSLIALLLNNVDIAKDPTCESNEPDIRRKKSELFLAEYLLKLRENWHQEQSLSKDVLAWFQIGEQWQPFSVEHHLRSLMDRRIGGLVKKTDCVVLKETEDARLYYYTPQPGLEYLITSFPKKGKKQTTLSKNIQPFTPSGKVCNGTGCAGEVTQLIWETQNYKSLFSKEKFNANVLFNIAPMVCDQPVNIGTEFAYDAYNLSLKTVNIFLEPACENMKVTVFET